MTKSEVQYHLLHGFEDPLISPEIWNNMVQQGSTNEIFLIWQWQKAWWEVFGRGKLILILAEHGGKPFCIAPLFADHGMIYFTGSGGSDYLDFIGSPGSSIILEKMLVLATEQISGFLGFLFYHIPEHSLTLAFLEEIVTRRNWQLFDEGEQLSPRFDLSEFPEVALQACRKKSLVRHETWFKRNGVLKIDHLQRKEDIVPLLDQFFNQHIERWAMTPFPSLFLKPSEQLFYRRVTDILSETGWLRFTAMNWNGDWVAFHFGFNYNDLFYWYKPSFNAAMAKHSPGEVLLRNLFMNAIEEKDVIFDFGLGDEAFKTRFATGAVKVKNRGLYPLK